MGGNRNIRNRLGWVSRDESERLYAGNRRADNRAQERQTRSDERITVTIPVLAYRRRILATLNTLGQLSTVSQDFASYALTKGATFREVVYKFNDIRRRVNTVSLPIATNRGANMRFTFWIDRNLTGSAMILGLPAMRKLGLRLTVGKETARITRRVVRRTSRQRMPEEERRGPNRHRRRPRTPARGHENRRRQHDSEDEDVIVGLSREEIQEIESWG